MVRAGKARYIGFSEWPVDRIEAALAIPRGREIRIEPAAVLAAASRARKGALPAVQPLRHLADRLVAAGAGHVDGKISSRRSPAHGQPRRRRLDEGFLRARLVPAKFLRAIQALRPLADQAGLTTRAILRWPGCCASPMSPPRSSARPGRTRSMRMSPLRDISARGSFYPSRTNHRRSGHLGVIEFR